MRKLFLSILIIIQAACLALPAQNPICPMGVYFADPSARVTPDGKLYLYGSRDESTEYYCSDRYDILSTTDMRHWDLHADSFAWDNVLYAPDAAFKDGRTFLYFDTCDGREYVAEGDSPVGPFRDAVEIDCPRQIDPAVFFDTDGQAYFFYSQMSSRVAKLRPDMKTPEMDTFVEGTVNEGVHAFHEGSFVFKRGKYYYYVYADISRGRPTCLGYSMATSVLGPYTYKGVIIDNAGCDPEVWNNHGSVVRFRGRWYVFYHRATHASKMMRKACVEPIRFNRDGTIDEVEMTTQGAGKPLKASEDIDAARACLMSGNVRVEGKGDASGRETLSRIKDGDTAVWKYIRFRRKDSGVVFHVNAPSGALISLFADGPEGQLLARVEVPAGCGWRDVRAQVASIRGVHALHAVFGAPCGSEFQLDCIRFVKDE